LAIRTTLNKEIKAKIMINKELISKLNEQIGSEFSASQHYLGIATYFAKQSLDNWADFFFRQAEEERLHGMKILKFLIDNDADVTFPAIKETHSNFADALSAVTSALKSEQKVSQQFVELAEIASHSNDYRGLQFLQWFIEEQVEEEATMKKLIDLIESGLNLFQAQAFLPQLFEPAQVP